MLNESEVESKKNDKIEYEMHAVLLIYEKPPRQGFYQRGVDIGSNHKSFEDGKSI